MRAFVAGLTAAAGFGLLADAGVFTPTIVEPAAAVVVRSYAGAANDGLAGTLYAHAAEGYSDGPFYVANITAPTHYGAGCVRRPLAFATTVREFSCRHSCLPCGLRTSFASAPLRIRFRSLLLRLRLRIRRFVGFRGRMHRILKPIERNISINRQVRVRQAAGQ